MHTPGPYKVSHGLLPGDSGWSIISNNALAKNVKVVAECWPATIVSEEHRRELFDNCRLFLASPELLEALEDIVARNEIQHWFNLDKARAAIAKARGGKS